jgi:phosphorylcholine metabolism protein LicD
LPKLNPHKNVFGHNVPLWERGQHGGRTRPMDRDVAFDNAAAVSGVFTELGIKHCLSHGTILGVYRDGDTIPWDDDVDMALFSVDRDKYEEARHRLRALGFFVPNEGNPKKRIEAYGSKANMPYYDFVAIRNGEKLEGWIFDLVGDYYIYDKARDGLTIPKRFFDTLSTVTWRGLLFPAPSDIEGFLTIMYDSTWRTPDPEKKYNDLREKDFES